jgi:hypothetical protein
MNEHIRLEKPELAGWINIETGENMNVNLEAECEEWREIACALYNAAHEEDYRLMVSAMKRYEEAASE